MNAMNIPREKLEQWHETLRRYVALDQHQDRQSGGSLCQTDLHRSALAALSSIEAELEQPQQPEQPVNVVSPVPTKASTRLLPCPFCGSKDIALHSEAHEPGAWFAQCQTCIAAAPYFNYETDRLHTTKAEARAAWNSRAVEAASGPAQQNKTEPASSPSQPQGEQSTEVFCSCGDAIMPDTGAKCGTCVYVASLRSTAPESPQAAAQSTALDDLMRTSEELGLYAQSTALEPVAWRHNRTLCLYETEEEVPLADGDEWAEPLYATPSAAMALLGDLREFIDDVHAGEWGGAPDRRDNLIARIDALTGTGRKEQSNG